MRVSQNGIDLIKHFEGLSLSSYQDVAGIWTIGYGHTGSEVGPDQEISEEEAEDLLRKDLSRFEQGVTNAVKVDINQNQFDALVSLSFNIGLSAFRSSTTLRRLNAGDYEGAAEAITWWNKATINGQKQVVNGLVRRRSAEKTLFLEPVDAGRPVETQSDSSRVTPEENSPRRGNVAGSRTMEGAVVAGTGGAAGVGAAVLGRGGDETTDTPQTQDTETPDRGTPDDGAPSGSSSDDTAGDTPPADDSASDGQTTGADDGADGGQADGAGDGGAAETPASEADGDAGAVTDSPATGEDVPAAGEDGTQTGTDETTTETQVPTPPPAEKDITRDEYVEAIQIIAGVIVVIAVLYIVFARVDDWMNHRR